MIQLWNNDPFPFWVQAFIGLNVSLLSYLNQIEMPMNIAANEKTHIQFLLQNPFKIIHKKCIWMNLENLAEAKEMITNTTKGLSSCTCHISLILFPSDTLSCTMSNVPSTSSSHKALDTYVRPFGHAQGICLPALYTTSWNIFSA